MLFFFSRAGMNAVPQQKNSINSKSSPEILQRCFLTQGGSFISLFDTLLVDVWVVTEHCVCVLTRPDLPTAASVLRDAAAKQNKPCWGNLSVDPGLSLAAEYWLRAPLWMGKETHSLEMSFFGMKAFVRAPEMTHDPVCICAGGALILGSLPPCQDPGESCRGGQTSPPFCPWVFCFWGRENPLRWAGNVIAVTFHPRGLRVGS